MTALALLASCDANPRAGSGTTSAARPPAAPSTTAGLTAAPVAPLDAPAAATTSTTSTPSTAPTTSTTVDPGTLPQTKDRPTADDPALLAGIDLLWRAITADDPDLALAAFFPQSAYRQAKAVSYPDADWTNRLVAHFREDVHALHVRLGSTASSAQLSGIDVPTARAVWVAPGSEYNKLSYWRVYGSTLRYVVDGQPHTLPVTSLISWRGRWYVVHLGAIR